MYIKYRKKIFFFLKKYSHNLYKNYFLYNFIKKIFFKKIKFFNKNCFFLKKNTYYNFFCFFYNIFYIKKKFIINKLKLINYSILLLFFFYNNNYLFITFKNFCYLIFIYKNSKCLFFFSKYIFLTNYFLYNNNIFFYNNFVFKKNNIFFNNFLIKKKNYIKNLFFLKNINFFIKLLLKNFIFNNNCFYIEFFFSINYLNFFKINSNIFTIKKIKKIKIFQYYLFYLNKKNSINLNLNIYIKIKNIFCKHKIIIFNNLNYNCLKKGIKKCFLKYF